MWPLKKIKYFLHLAWWVPCRNALSPSTTSAIPVGRVTAHKKRRRRRKRRRSHSSRFPPPSPPHDSKEEEEEGNTFSRGLREEADETEAGPVFLAEKEKCFPSLSFPPFLARTLVFLFYLSTGKGEWVGPLEAEGKWIDALLALLVLVQRSCAPLSRIQFCTRRCPRGTEINHSWIALSTQFSPSFLQWHSLKWQHTSYKTWRNYHYTTIFFCLRIQPLSPLCCTVSVPTVQCSCRFYTFFDLQFVYTGGWALFLVFPLFRDTAQLYPI